jgi:hypothetical protein
VASAIGVALASCARHRSHGASRTSEERVYHCRCQGAPWEGFLSSCRRCLLWTEHTLAVTCNRTICQRVIWKVPLKVMLADFGCSKRSCWHNLEDQLFHKWSDENSESTTVFLSSSTFQRYNYIMLA